MRRFVLGRKTAVFSVLALLWMLVWPGAVFAKAGKPPVNEPFEKVVFKQGSWATEYMDIDGQSKLIVQYTGSMEQQETKGGSSSVQFRLGSKMILKGLYIPTNYSSFRGPLPPGMHVVFKDGKGNIYGPFYAATYHRPKIEEMSRPPVSGGSGGQGNQGGFLISREGEIYVTEDESFSREGELSITKDETTGEPSGESLNANEDAYADNIFVASPDEIIVLPAGTYTVYFDTPGALVRNKGTGGKPALLIKGIDYKAWEEYQKKLQEWESEQEGREKQEETDKSVLGNEDLAGFGLDPEKHPEPSDVGQGAAPPVKKPAVFTLDQEARLDMVVLNTFNEGQGAIPQKIQVVDSKNQVVALLSCTGAVLQGVPNGMWMARSSVTLPAGTYLLRVPDPDVLVYDEEGNPDFAVMTSPAKPKLYYFNGTYLVNVDVIKTSTLMGPVAKDENPFQLRNFRLTVLDREDTIELVGMYENMPFSQTCKVTKRDLNRVEALLQAGMDLKDLPYKAKIGASVLIVLEKPPGLQPKITVSGTGTYERVSKEMGNDYNTYRITANGYLATTEFPAFVMAAIAKQTGSVGNIPGPDSPFTAATGMLFPPLAALIANLIQEAIRSKLTKEQLLDIELAKQGIKKYSLAWYQAKYPGRTKEQLAWIMLADALANSDEPDEDPFSVGDDEKAAYERPGYEAPGEEFEPEGREEQEAAYPEEAAEEAGVGFDADEVIKEVALTSTLIQDEQKLLEAERDEWLKNLQESLKSADPNDPRAKELHKQYEDYINYLNNRIKEIEAIREYESQPKMTLQVDHTGRTAEIAFDSKTGQWYNTETGNVFDMERYQKDVVPSFEKDAAFIAEQRRKLETRDTAFDRLLDATLEDQKRRTHLLGQLQKWRNEAYGIEPPAPGVGYVNANIDRLIKDISNTEIPVKHLEDRAKRIGKVVIDRRTGATMSEAEARSLAERELSAASILAHTTVEGAVDVVTGRTWAGMAGRAVLAGLTGGASEYVMSPAEALFDIKESIEGGESGVRATLKAMGKYALGELAGAYMGKAWEHSGYQLNQELVEKLTKWGNTPVSELIGRGGKTGAQEGWEKVITSKSKVLLEGAGGGKPYKLPDDVTDYTKYKAGVKNQASLIEGKIRAGQEPSLEDIRKVLRDPSISRELKGSHIDIQNGYQDALEKNIYNPAKNNTASRLEQDMLEKVQKEFGPDAKIKVEVESIRTPGAKGSRINADNDLTGRITITDANGRTITKELPAKDVAKIYNEEFAKAAGMVKDGKFDITKAKLEMPEGVTVIGKDGKPRQIPWEEATYEQQLEAFAKKHGQEVTDRGAAEAAIDFSPDASPTGVSNVAQLKAGVSTAKLADPEGLAKMEQYKINNYFNKGGIANQTEAYEQLAKMGKLTKDLTSAYQKLGFKAADLPPNMEKALEIVGNRRLSPGARNVELQKLGFDGPQDLANKLSARIEGIQKLGKPIAGKPQGRVLEKVVGAIVRSHLNQMND